MSHEGVKQNTTSSCLVLGSICRLRLRSSCFAIVGPSTFLVAVGQPTVIYWGIFNFLD
jgi:hypothetical protein